MLLTGSPFMPDVYDQGVLGSCTANAGAGCVHYKLRERKISDIFPSRRFLYWWERSFMNMTNQDSGAHLVYIPGALRKYGICDEQLCPYGDTEDKQKSLVITKPTQESMDAAAKNKFSLIYGTVGGGDLSQDPNGQDERLDSLTNLKTVLAAGTPVAFGFSIYPYFYDALMQTPSDGDMSFLIKKSLLRKGKVSQSRVAGHAITIVGYDSANKKVIIRNSWGTTWGDSGYAYMPEEFLTFTR